MDETNITLAVLIVVFAIGLVAVDKTFQGEGEVFQVFANLLSGLVAALLARITPPKTQDAINSAISSGFAKLRGLPTDPPTPPQMPPAPAVTPPDKGMSPPAPPAGGPKP